MRLHQFLETNAEHILAEWVAFARTQPGAAEMNLPALRDHAAGMLTDIVADLRSSQSAEEQLVKSHGEAPASQDGVATSAEAHGADRADSGFSAAEMLAEFRALRASVLRLWATAKGGLTGADLNDLTRFNEAIDQALAESIARFHASVTQSQDLFVAILGHDLRTPLHTVSVVTEYVAAANVLDAEYASLMERAVRSSKRMARMLDDLLDFTRSRSGSGMLVNRRDADLQPVVEDAVDEFRNGASHPVFAVNVSGDLRGMWDGPRIGQVLSNLLGNAVQHGDPAAPVEVSARGHDDEVVLEIRNAGPAIAAADLPTLFSPFKRLRRTNTAFKTHHLGLGLYIAHQIVTAHGGRIVVTSTAGDGTCFTAHLPRRETRAAI